MLRCARVAALLAVVVLGGACRKEGRLADASRDGGSNLLLITLDTTRADRIGAYGDSRASTPTIDRLAREGVRFERAYTVAPLTLPAHVTLMTGREPQAHQVRNNGTYTLRPEETTLAEILRPAGFSTMAMIAAYVLEKKFGLDQGFAGYDDELNTSGEATTFRSEIPADRVHEKFTRWLKSDPATPFFCWVHLYDPHHPYAPPEEFRRRFPDDPYRGEVAFMDEVIGRMLRDLDGRGLLKNTLVVVAGDHGEGFGEHEESGHGVFCYEETLRVPLIFHQPRLLRGNRVVTQPVGLVDVMPTLLELYRLPLPAGIQGRSLARLLTVDEDPARPAPALYFESMNGMEEMGWAPLSGLLRGSLKYISLPRPELYDLAIDPLEKDNLYLKKNVQAKGLARDLDTHLEKTVSADKAALRLLQSRQDQDRLRALGYLAAGGPSPRARSNDDPKDGIGTMNLLLEAREAIHVGDLDKASRQIAALRATGIDRTLPQFHDTSYELALARKDPAVTEAVLNEAIARFPEETRFLMLLAGFHRDRGDERKTETTALLLLERDPKASQPHLLLGELYRGQKRIDKAIGHFQQAWDLEPGNHKLAIALADMNIETGHPEQALAALRKLVQAGQVPGSPLAVEIRAQASKLLVRLGEPDLAESLLQDLVREQRGNPAHWTQLGLAQLERGQGEQAMRSFQQALQLDPQQALALSGLGTLHLNLFRQRRDRRGLEMAAGFFSRALEADARLITAVNGLGVVHLYLGDAPKAIGQFRSALVIDPGFVNAHFNLAIAQLRAGQRLEARRTLNTLKQKLAGRLSDAERGQLAALLREAGS